MVEWRVKRKLRLAPVLAGLSIVTFLASWAQLLTRNWVEKAYSEFAFPTVSHISSFVADAVPFSWLDIAVLALAGVIIYSLRTRNVAVLVATLSAGYLWFFWSWGLNYHRPSLESRMHIDASGIHSNEVD